MAVAMSEEEIEREVRTLKNLRRRSTTSAGPGELAVDPDLPPREAFEHHQGPSYSSNDDVTLSLDGDAGLFWVPAHLHPELAPGEFRQFLKHHTQVDPSESGEAGEASLARSPSWLARSRSMSGSLNRKKSMLSKQYTPRAGDKVEEEAVPLARRGSQNYADTGMTLRDLQRLEEMVDSEWAEDPEKMRHTLRNVSGERPGSIEEEAEGVPPLPAPRPGSIIRRTARTRIRKGDTKNRRFSSSARKPRASEEGAGSVDDEHRSYERRSDERRSDETSDERASYETADAQSKSSSEAARLDRSQTEDDSNDEALIFDAYARDRSSTSTMASSTAEDESRPASPPDDNRPSLHPILTPRAEDRWYDDEELTPTQDSSLSDALRAMSFVTDGGELYTGETYAGEPLQKEYGQRDYEHEEYEQKAPPPAPVTHQEPQLPPGMAPPLPGATTVPGLSQNRTNGPIPPALAIERPTLARTDSNMSSVSSSSSAATPSTQSHTAAPAPAAPPGKAHKEKKSGLFSKKGKDKDKDKEKTKKEKDGFLGSLFGSKKKTEESSSVSNFGTAGPAAAAALLGTSKSAKSLHAGSGTSSPTSPGFSSFARYPIHVERAVYRLSHIKLANARRPLIEQVLISNLMFWYLGVIGRAAGPAEDAKPGTVNGLDKDRDESARNPPSKGTPPQPSEGGALKRVKQPAQQAQAQVGSVHEQQQHHQQQQHQQQYQQHQQQQHQQHHQQQHHQQQQHQQQHQQQLHANNGAPVSQRKTGLVKPERSRVANNSEAPLRAPQYGVQNAQVEKEMRHAPAQQHKPEQHPHPQHASHHAPPQQHLQPNHNHHAPQAAYTHTPQAQTQPAPAKPNRTSSIPPNRALSPPSSMAPPRSPEYPPGVAPPRPQSFTSGRPMPPTSDSRQRVSVPPGQMRPPHSPSPPLQHQHQNYPRNAYPAGAAGPRTSPPPHGPQPGQIFQYPGQQRGPQPGQIFTTPQPGQIFHHPQFRPSSPVQPQQQGQGQQQWTQQQQQQQQQLGQGQPGQRAPVQGPPRRTSSNPQEYRQAQPGQGPPATSPTQQSFYGRPGAGPGGPGGFAGYPNGQARPQAVPSGQYPHHRMA